jgi:cupin fold WbuC family metalloprotein
MIINDAMLDALCTEASISPRRRKNLNFHASETVHCNRLLNAVEPDSYIQPHRHLDPEKDESIILLRGRLGVLFFSDGGEIVLKAELSRKLGTYGVDIPHGTCHTVLSLESGTVFFESKSGPYVPLSDRERAVWAPREGEGDASAYLEYLKGLFMS